MNNLGFCNLYCSKSGRTVQAEITLVING